jgi:hypothetical protein
MRLTVLPVLAFIFFNYEVALACSCTISPPPAEALRRAQAVFAGEVVRVREPRPTLVRNRRGKVVAHRINLMAEVRFKVTKVWKGIEKDTVMVGTMTGCCACGYGFVEGEQYLVYAYGDGRDGLTTSICSRTKKLEAAQEDLAELGDGKVPTRHAAPSQRRRVSRSPKPNNGMHPIRISVPVMQG